MPSGAKDVVNHSLLEVTDKNIGVCKLASSKFLELVDLSNCRFEPYLQYMIEIDKTYNTNWAATERFTVKEIVMFKGKQIKVNGIFEKSPHLGLCPLDVNQLRVEKEKLINCLDCSFGWKRIMK